jgi:hypothetical protein
MPCVLLENVLQNVPSNCCCGLLPPQDRLKDKAKGAGPAVVAIEVERKTSIWNYQVRLRAHAEHTHATLATSNLTHRPTRWHGD